MNASAAMFSAIWCDAERHRIERPGERRGRGEDADLQRHLRCGRKAERDEPLMRADVEGERHMRCGRRRAFGARARSPGQRKAAM